MTKKIAVVAANGRVAGKVIEEAVSRGFDVTGFGRKANNTKAQHYVQKDLFDLTKEDLQGFDAVVDAAGAWTLDTMYVIPKAAIYLADLLKGTETRMVVVGGAGSLASADIPGFVQAGERGARPRACGASRVGGCQVDVYFPGW